MGHGGLYALVFLELLVVVFERSGGDVTRCWVKGKEVILHPHQCPAEFDGADAKFCCRLCYGANCCLPRKPRVNLARCPRDAQLAATIRDRRTSPSTAAPDAETTAPLEEKRDQTVFGLITGVLSLVLFYLVLHYSCLRWKRFWEFLAKHCYEGEEESRVNTVCSRVLPQNPLRSNLRQPNAMHLEDLPTYSRFDPYGSQDLPPPYPGEPARGPRGALDLPPPYPGEPVVAFRRAGSRAQDDIAVILPVLPAPPEASVTGGAPGAAAAGGAPEEAGFPEADLIDFSEEAATGGAPEEVDLPEAAATGGALEEEEEEKEEEKKEGALQGVAASDGAPEPPE